MTFEDCYRKFGPKKPSNDEKWRRYNRWDDRWDVAKTNVPFAGARPLQYSPEDYVIVLGFEDMNNQNLCKAIKGQAIPGFFTNGYDTVSFDRPIAVSQGEMDNSVYLCVSVETIRVCPLCGVPTVRRSLTTYSAYRISQLNLVLGVSCSSSIPKLETFVQSATTGKDCFFIPARLVISRI